MSIEIRTIEDLIRVLKEHPEWREPLIEALLGMEFLQLPARLDRIEQVLERLVESHEHLWESHRQLQQSHELALERLERLEAVTQHLVEGYRQLIQEHQLLVAQMRELRQIVERLTDWAQRIDTDVGKLKGKVLELDYLERAPARFGYYVRRPRVVNIGHFLDDLREKGHEFTQEEWTQLSMIDVLLEAQHPHTREPIYLAIEVSWMLFPHDVERAHQRAELLRAHGVNAYAAVAGEGFVPEAHEMAVQHKVLMLTDGQVLSDTNPFRPSN